MKRRNKRDILSFLNDDSWWGVASSIAILIGLAVFGLASNYWSLVFLLTYAFGFSMAVVFVKNIKDKHKKPLRKTFGDFWKFLSGIVPILPQ